MTLVYYFDVFNDVYGVLFYALLPYHVMGRGYCKLLINSKQLPKTEGDKI